MARKISLLRFGENNLPGKLSGMKERFSQDEISSIYNDHTTKVGNAVCFHLYDVLKLYFQNNPNRECFLGETKNGYVVELSSVNEDSTQVVYLKNIKGTYTIYAGTITGTPESPVIRNDYKIAETGVPGFSGTAVLLALMPIILNDGEAIGVIDDLKNCISIDPESDWWEQNSTKKDSDGNFKSNLLVFSELMCLLTDNIYRRMKDPIFVGDKAIKIAFEKNTDIRGFQQSFLKEKVTPIIGETIYFNGNVPTEAEDEEEYFLSGRDFSDDQKKLIPTIPSWYVMPEELERDCQLIVDTTDFPSPIRTVFLVGPAGVGKTEWVRSTCAKLGIPYDHITCNPQMEIFDFIGQIFPNTDPSRKMSFSDVAKQMGMPSTEDIINDPQGAYVAIHKQMPPSYIDVGELMNTMINMVNTKMAELCDSKDYTYIESGLIKAIRYGYGFEVQEIGIIQRAGVAVGINALLESGHNAFITLPTGEVVKKHPNCCIFFTSNDEYEGTTNLNQSVLSRMGIVHWFKNTSAQVMAERVRDRLKFDDFPVLVKMARCIENINDFCHEKDITDGVCGPRELENWAMALMTQKKRQNEEEYTNPLVRETAQYTILNKVSQTWDDVVDVAQGCVDSLFGTCEMLI